MKNRHKKKKEKKVNKVFQNLYKEDKLPDRISDNYEIVSCIHYTDTKQVYILKDRKSNKNVILKCRSGYDAGLSKNEYNTLKAVESEYVPLAYDFFVENEKTYMLREYIEGDTLEQHIDRKGVYESKAAVDAMISICQGIEFMHKKNPPVVHRDIKPQNIIYTKEGKYKFIDLDTAREFKDENTYDTVFMGTRATAAPEQFGFKQTSVRSDIYSLGVLFLYLLTGDYRVKEEEWKKLPKAIRRTIDKCLAFDPDNRYATVSALIKELKCLRRFSMRRRTLFTYQVAAAGVIIALALFARHSILRYKFENETVKFSNPRIESAVRQSLNIDDNVIIHPVDMENISTLILCGDRIFTSWEEHRDYHDTYYSEFNNEELDTEEYDFSDLEYLPNLKTLVLDNQGITDVSVLDGLDLERICLEKNNLTDLNGIKEQKNLMYLNISNNPISDIEELRELDNLEGLNISNTGVSDISCLEGMAIREFNCSYNNVTDYSVLSSLDHLNNLMISYADKETISYINTIENMQILSLSNSEIESLSELSNLTKLECIDLSLSKKIDSLTGIENFPRLSFLGIAETGITDISILPQVTSLEMLDITNAGLDSLSPVADCGRLNTIFIDSGKEAELKRYDISDRIDIIIN